MPRRSSPPAEEASPLAEAVARCRAERRSLPELRDVLARAEAAVEAEGATCRQCGACCRFEEFGHRLYVTPGELALLTSAPPREPPQAGRCPYQVADRCGARDRRPLGCRLFFCDLERRGGPHELYERFHRQIGRLHDRRGWPYLYVELSGALAELFAP